MGVLLLSLGVKSPPAFRKVAFATIGHQAPKRWDRKDVCMLKMAVQGDMVCGIYHSQGGRIGDLV
jgi:hypothetical protein